MSVIDEYNKNALLCSIVCFVGLLGPIAPGTLSNLVHGLKEFLHVFVVVAVCRCLLSVNSLLPGYI